MALKVEIWAMGETLNWKELDWFTMGRQRKKMDLDERWQRRESLRTF